MRNTIVEQTGRTTAHPVVAVYIIGAAWSVFSSIQGGIPVKGVVFGPHLSFVRANTQKAGSCRYMVCPGVQKIFLGRFCIGRSIALTMILQTQAHIPTERTKKDGSGMMDGNNAFLEGCTSHRAVVYRAEVSCPRERLKVCMHKYS